MKGGTIKVKSEDASNIEILVVYGLGCRPQG